MPYAYIYLSIYNNKRKKNVECGMVVVNIGSIHPFAHFIMRPLTTFTQNVLKQVNFVWCEKNRKRIVRRQKEIYSFLWLTHGGAHKASKGIM